MSFKSWTHLYTNTAVSGSGYWVGDWTASPTPVIPAAPAEPPDHHQTITNLLLPTTH